MLYVLKNIQKHFLDINIFELIFLTNGNQYLFNYKKYRIKQL